MKNFKVTRFVSVFLAIAILSSGMVYPISASEGPPEGAMVEDMFSSWAYWDIFMAQNVYELGNEGTYSNFRGDCTFGKLHPVAADLLGSFWNHDIYGNEIDWMEIDWDEYDINEKFTRGEMIEFFFKNSKEIKMNYLLVDSRFDIMESDLLMIEYLIDLSLPITIILTKIDKVSTNEISKRKAYIKSCFEDQNLVPEIIPTSSNLKKGMKLIIDQIKLLSLEP